MKRSKVILVLVFVMLFVLSGCAGDMNVVSKNELYLTPQFTKYEETDKPQEKVFDVLKLEFAENKINYTDIGDMSKFKFLLKGVSLRYSGLRAVTYTGDIESSVYESELPIYFFNNTENAEGIIVFKGVPYSFYYNDKGEAFVKCLEIRFNDYFEEDKPYNDFINWAKNYEPKLDDEDLLSR